MTYLKSSVEKGQIWLEKIKESKFTEQTYVKLKSRILSKGAMTFSDYVKHENLEDSMTRERIHSIDIGELENFKSENPNLFERCSSELIVVQKIPHNMACKKWTRCKKEKVVVKSPEDELMVVPTFLLTFNPKFSKISNGTSKSHSSIELNKICESPEK